MSNDSIVEYVEVPGATLWTSRRGSGPPLVLLHGGPGLWDYLGPVAEMVDDLATVYRYDQRACGRSSGGPPFTLEAAIADLEALREYWGHERWVVLGHSWGATVGLAYCLAHPERAQALIYMSGTGIYTGWRDEFHRNAAALMPPEAQERLNSLGAQMANAQSDELAALTREYCIQAWSVEMQDRERSHELAESALIEGAQINWELNRELSKDGRRAIEDSSIPERLATLNVPTLVLHGEADARPAWAGHRVAEAIPGARYVGLPGVGHFTWLDGPELLREEARRFLVQVL